MLNHIIELELTPPFDGEDVRKAYVRLVKRYPPARSPEKFRRLNEAFEALGNDRNRVRTELYWAYDFDSVPEAVDALESAVELRDRTKTLDAIFRAEGHARNSKT